MLKPSKPRGVARVAAMPRTYLSRAAKKQKESMGMWSAIYKQATPTGFWGSSPERNLSAAKDVGNDKPFRVSAYFNNSNGARVRDFDVQRS